jgi:alkylation response protein AidB-like acyl-CoA dehydrogenase
VVEPFIETVVLAGSLLQQAGPQVQRDQFLPDIMAGEIDLGAGLGGRRSRTISTRLPRRRGARVKTYVLSGTKASVIGHRGRTS